MASFSKLTWTLSKRFRNWQRQSWTEAAISCRIQRSGDDGTARLAESQIDEHKTEPNSGLGKAITYLSRHWRSSILFLRAAGAPLDNNIAERALKQAVLRRKNALFHRRLHGAQVGDRFMSLIPTCQLCDTNSFEYLTERQRHAQELAASPAEWMRWNYRQRLSRGGME